MKGSLPCLKHNLKDLKKYSIEKSTPIICFSSDPATTTQYHLLGLTTDIASINTINYRVVPSHFNEESELLYSPAFKDHNSIQRLTDGLSDMEEPKSLRRGLKFLD